MRRIAFLTALVALLVPATASAASFIYDVPDLLEKPLAAVNRVSEIPVLLPSRITTEHPKLYSAGKGRKNRYEF